MNKGIFKKYQYSFNVLSSFNFSVLLSWTMSPVSFEDKWWLVCLMEWHCQVHTKCHPLILHILMQFPALSWSTRSLTLGSTLLCSQLMIQFGPCGIYSHGVAEDVMCNRAVVLHSGLLTLTHWVWYLNKNRNRSKVSCVFSCTSFVYCFPLTEQQHVQQKNHCLVRSCGAAVQSNFVVEQLTC